LGTICGGWGTGERKVAISEEIKMPTAINIFPPMMFVLALCVHANAQSDLDARDFVMPTPGVSGAFPPDVFAKVDSSAADIGSTVAASSAFLKEYKSNVHATRNARDIAVYRNAAPAVVLVIVKNGFGTGSLLEDNNILTNWHVVNGSRQVNVIFKPVDPFKKPSDDDMVTAQVIKTDAVHDLALLRPRALPSRAIKPIMIAAQDNIEVGADVRAIGHPTGEIWTYTTGIVSQIRPDYEWSYDERDIKHHATVIQTQTPINPGSSGGPLLGDDGQLIGVNTFGPKDTQGVNFAISARDVRAFLIAPVAQNPPDQCKSRVIFEGRNKDNTAFLRAISLKCDDRADITIVVPDDKKKAVMALIDISRRDKVEGIVLDERRSGKWNTSFWDPKLDETFPLRGIHPDGELLPTSREPRCPPRSRPLKDFKCS
jgi:S1-C subfamily serine protease